MNWITLFPECVDVEIIKDVGMIPYILNKQFGYYSKLVCFRNSNSYSNISKYATTLRIEFLKKYKSELYSVFKYLRTNSKKIDILNVYHFGAKSSLLYAYIYKFFNPHGIVYLKLDIDNLWIEKLKRLSKIKKTVCRYLLKSVDIISAETRFACVEVEKLLNRKVEFVPNGYYWFEQIRNVNKENIILTVGRLGTEQKNIELLVDSFANLNPKHWQLMLVGSYTPDFKEYVDKIIKDYQLDKKIILIGAVNDRKTLHKIYLKSKIFALPSRWESFGIVLLEALSNENFVITTDAVISAKDLIDESCGIITKNDSVYDFTNSLKEAIRIVDNKLYSFHWSQEQNYQWINICSKINDLIISYKKKNN